MKSKILLVMFLAILSLVMMTAVVFGQEEAEENTGLRFDMVASPLKFHADGEVSAFKSPAIFGVAKDYEFLGVNLTYGLYFSYELDTTDDDAKHDIGSVLFVKIFGKFGVGGFYDFWSSGEGNGFLGLNKERIGFLLGYDFKL